MRLSFPTPTIYPPGRYFWMAGLARQAANGDKGIYMLLFPVQLTTSRIGNLTRLIYTLQDVMAMHCHADIHSCADTNPTCKTYVDV